ncbi:MAG: AAA family ATPase [Candidatus Nanopelagicaceae bacterium]
MILFEKIRWKNFLSTGNHFIEIDLEKNKTTLIIGQNGAGKSTILDAITFGLFGKSFRGINKSQLINSANEKDCVIEIEFKIGTVSWKVIRGIKPSIFVIERNGKAIDQQSSVTDQQKWFEQSVLKMNYKSFTQVVIIGSSNFVPFMQLSASNRREVIEDLLDIKIFSSMNSLVKDKIKELKDQVKTLDLSKDSLKDKISMQENFIQKIQNEGETKVKENITEISFIKSQIDVCSAYNAKYEEEIFSYTKELEDLSSSKDKLKKLASIKGKLSQKVATITEEHEFFRNNSVCPTCTQNIEESFRLNRISDAINKAKELQSGYEELEQTIRDEEIRESHFLKISKEVTNLTHEISQNNLRISGFQKRIGDLEKEIQRITNNLENENIEHEKLAQFKQKLNNIFEELSEKKETISYYDFCYGLLKDSGVKTTIIKKYLPLINQQVNRYLQMMDFYINFSLDEEFNETIQSPIHEDFTYGSFSEGERQRIDLALLFTWREVAKLKNSTNTNLLIMDEVFDSSLDGNGTEEFIKIIRYVVKDSNIFIISHKVGMEDRFENVVKFEKCKGFSQIA